MTGRTVLITGAAAGIGLVTARELALVGAPVVQAVRNIDKARQATTDMRGDFELRHLDVADLNSVRAPHAANSIDVRWRH